MPLRGLNQPLRGLSYPLSSMTCLGDQAILTKFVKRGIRCTCLITLLSISAGLEFKSNSKIVHVQKLPVVYVLSTGHPMFQIAGISQGNYNARRAGRSYALRKRGLQFLNYWEEMYLSLVAVVVMELLSLPVDGGKNNERWTSNWDDDHGNAWITNHESATRRLKQNIPERFEILEKMCSGLQFCYEGQCWITDCF